MILCTLLAAMVPSRHCCADSGCPSTKKVMSHLRDGPGVRAPLLHKTLYLSLGLETSPLLTEVPRALRAEMPRKSRTPKKSPKSLGGSLGLRKVSKERLESVLDCPLTFWRLFGVLGRRPRAGSQHWGAKSPPPSDTPPNKFRRMRTTMFGHLPLLCIVAAHLRALCGGASKQHSHETTTFACRNSTSQVPNW